MFFLYVFFLLTKFITTDLKEYWTLLERAITPKKDRNKRGALKEYSKVAQTSGQHHGLIKQGITGLHQDSYYRPLEESSGGCVFVSQSSHSTVLKGLHVAVGHETALIKSVPLPFLFPKISFAPECSTFWNAKVKIQPHTNRDSHKRARYFFVDSRRDYNKAVCL